MLQLIKLNKDIKKKRLGTTKRWLYHYTNSSLILEEEDICVLTAHGSTCLFTFNADMNNNAVYFFNGIEGVAASTVSAIAFTPEHPDRVHDLEAEINRLREEVSRLRNAGSNETTERTDPYA